MAYDIEQFSAQSGRIIKEDNTTVNSGDLLEALVETVDTVKGKLAITGTIAATTVVTTNASGTFFTKSGDSVYLGADETEFNDNAKLKIFLNGVLQEKGIDVIFVTAYSMYFNIIMNTGDAVIIIKGI